MAIIDRFNVRALAAGASVCGIAIALSPDVAAAPLMTAYECPPGAPPAKECVAAAPVADMAGVPMALPGPLPAAPVPVVPAAPLVPVIPAAPVPVVPAAAPAPLAGGAAVATAGGFAGKGDPIVPVPAGAPVPGQPLPAGPSTAK